MNDLQLDEDRGPVLIAVGTDANEDAALVRDAVADRGNKGVFTIAPEEMTQVLVSEFGPSIVNPPTAPIIVIDADQVAPELMPRGIKSLQELESAVEAAR